MKMNPHVKKEWVAALRSRQYKQGARYLCKGDRYNAFGVLFDACIVGDWTYDEHTDSWNVDNSGSLLPATIAEGVGLYLGDEFTIMTMNDVHSVTFKEIATWIERNL